jgi:hypothetical protein
MDRNELFTKSGRLLMRSEVARRLGVTTTTVRRLEGTVLHPRVNEKGERLFDPSEVERAANSRSTKPAPEASGEVAAEAFRLFRQGYDLEDIVMRLKQPPATIRYLFGEWCAGL